MYDVSYSFVLNLQSEPEPPIPSMGLFESVMATQGKETVAMETIEDTHNETVLQTSSDLSTEQTDIIETATMETENSESNLNQVKLESDSANLEKLEIVEPIVSDDVNVVSDGDSVVDKTVSAVTMEIVEETLNTVENACRNDSGDALTVKTGGSGEVVVCDVSEMTESAESPEKNEGGQAEKAEIENMDSVESVSKDQDAAQSESICQR